jgi:hypothetical protein
LVDNLQTCSNQSHPDQCDLLEVVGLRSGDETLHEPDDLAKGVGAYDDKVDSVQSSIHSQTWVVVGLGFRVR